MSSLSSLQTPVTPALKNILFATDFSPCSQAALPFARAIAERYGSTVHMVHILTPEPMMELPLDQIPELDADRDVAQKTMKTMLAGKPFGKVATTTTVERGPLWSVLAAILEEKHIDLMVLGTHGRRGLKKLVLGSVAEEVFRNAPCPVLTVGPEAIREGAVDTSFKTILFATDFYAGSQSALAYAISMARANNSHLILLHAVPDSQETIDLALAGQRMADLISAETMEELKPEIIAEYGSAAEKILNVANGKQVNLIVMGTRHAAMPAVAAHLPWTTASRVVCEAHCPTLTVRG
jgi:nucleotide-binding universal stress UspA family protein